jgi:NodT family efflux transporter outer membrane factor (OMF) lipoprotein
MHQVPDTIAPKVDIGVQHGEAILGPESDEPWWTDFEDPQLDGLIAAALQENPGLRATWARLKQADAALRGAGAAWWPQIEASGSASQSRINFGNNLPPGLPASVTEAQNRERFGLSLSAGYEIDLWGRIGSLNDASALERQATAEDIATHAMTLSARIAEAWFSIREAEAQLALLHQQRAVNASFLELVELRFSQGLASAVDVYQQRLQLAGIDTKRPHVEAQAALLRHQIAVLTGRPPGADIGAVPASLPNPPAMPPLGFPSDRLQQRPDLRALHHRVRAADHRVAAAIANQFPSIRLSGGTGFESTKIEDIFGGWVFNLASSVLAPIWDGGRRAAEVDRSRATVEELLHRYGEAVLNALREVEDALVLSNRQAEHLRALEIQLALAKATLEESRSRYVTGLSDYLPVLTALQALHRVEENHLRAQKDALLHQVRLCRALGGGWTPQLPHTPAPANEVHGS